jgi:hypothetical protein
MRLVTASTLPKSGKDLPNVIGGLRLMITEMAQRSARFVPQADISRFWSNDYRKN